MNGYELKEASYDSGKLTEERLWTIFSGMFSSRVSHDTTYKFGFFKSILDSLYNTDEDLFLSFDQLFYKFTEIYWNLILRYHLRQKAKTINDRETALERVLYEAFESQKINQDVSFEVLPDELKIQICHKVKMKCKENVVGALFGDSQGVMYSFSKKAEFIQINPAVYGFLTNHKKILEKMNYYEWAKFLEKVNDEATTRNLLNNLDTITLRNDLSLYRRILYKEFEDRKCFYCGRELKPDKIHVDHFIPWSFIKDDNLWNLVLACPECNLRKSDKLASITYVDCLVSRNDLFLQGRQKYDKLFVSYQSEKLRSIYIWAKLNGYSEIWEPKILNRI